jgi:hypothetical protein
MFDKLSMKNLLLTLDDTFTHLKVMSFLQNVSQANKNITPKLQINPLRTRLLRSLYVTIKRKNVMLHYTMGQNLSNGFVDALWALIVAVLQNVGAVC